MSQLVITIPSRRFAAITFALFGRICSSFTLLAMNYFSTLPDGSVDRLGRWKVKWRDDYNRQPGFHLSDVNPNLKLVLGAAFDPPKNEPILVPLCGKTLDLAWLRDYAGFATVCGVEGVPQAIQELREESLHDLREVQLPGGSGAGDKYISVWTTSPEDKEANEEGGWFMSKESGQGTISIVCTDFFELPASIFPPVATAAKDAGASNPRVVQLFGSAFDRGALVAVPPESRPQYVSKLDSLLKPGGQILLVTLDRDSDEGPPFKTTPDMVQDLFLPLGYDVSFIEEHTHDVKGTESKEFVLVATKKNATNVRESV